MTSFPYQDDPFVDPVAEAEHERSMAIDTTLVVGRDASLTLGTDSLIVLDEELEDESWCCGLFSSNSGNTRSIPFYNILWAEQNDDSITIDYAKVTSKTTVVAAKLTYPVESHVGEAKVDVWIDKLLDRAYGLAQKRKRAKVLINPHSGKGSAVKWYYRDIQPLLKVARCRIDVEQTKYQGEAMDIAQKMDIDAYDMVVACSGDGLPYEVFNGLARRHDARRALEQTAVVQLPCGSGNAMSCNLNGTDSTSLATLAVIKGIRTPLDLVSITQGETRTLSFLSQSVGIVAESDLATENLRWMGAQRFTYGFLVRLLGKTVYPCDIAVATCVEDKAEIKKMHQREQNNFAPSSQRRGNKKTLLDDDASTNSHSHGLGLPSLRYGTVNDKLPDGWEMLSYNNMGNFYCGNMAYMAADSNFFAAALPNDGLMDLVTIDGDIPTLTSISLLTSIESGKFYGNPNVRYRKVAGYRIIPKQEGEGYISIDGERVPFEPFQAEVHRGLGTVLSKSGHMFEAEGPRL